ncbi:hypothetical protein PILCRDRAFT_819235 [Piloderma croceum F 1598]|uniref:Uncharacterized protein n=1 Tax=Piloderma croceum (strain F 1598) TaxID=765440 RepID=A0A0C3FVU0_PILCF|nr:hypothetical protein PILCRDRAFT_819235 [Piloderma croceum F 1598]
MGWRLKTKICLSSYVEPATSRRPSLQLTSFHRVLIVHGLGIRTRYILVYLKAKRQSGHLIKRALSL